MVLESKPQTQPSTTRYKKQQYERKIYVKCPLLLIPHHTYNMNGKTWKSTNLIFYEQIIQINEKIQINFGMYNLALSNSHMYKKCMPKRPIIQNKMSEYEMYGCVNLQSHAILGQAWWWNDVHGSVSKKR